MGLALGIHTELTKGSAAPLVTGDQTPLLSGVSLGDNGHGVSSTLSCLSVPLLPSFDFSPVCPLYGRHRSRYWASGKAGRTPTISRGLVSEDSHREQRARGGTNGPQAHSTSVALAFGHTGKS